MGPKTRLFIKKLGNLLKRATGVEAKSRLFIAENFN